MKMYTIRPEYVEYIPKHLEDGVLYISNRFRTASHRCCCGCGTKIVTPFRETEYALTTRDGLVSIYPSIGNWNYPCQSHYWIRDNKVRWVRRWSREEINIGRVQDQAEKEKYFNINRPQDGVWSRLRKLLQGLIR